jgi:DNA-binding MarR family transcriptional regulator
MVRVADDFEEEYPGAARLATECYANLVRTGDLLIGLHNRQAKEDYGLSATAKMALAVVEGAGEPLAPSVIAERLLITTGSMTSMLDTLERRGLLRRMPHPNDRRKLLVDVTDEAVAVLDEMLPSFHQRERAVINGALSPEEQERLLHLVAKVQRVAQSMAEDPSDHSATRVRPARPAPST